MPETVTTHAKEETQQLAAEVAAKLAALPRDRAAVVTLRGELGAGKTTFAQGMLRALGVDQPVTSPTFVLVHRYPLERWGFANAYHVDAYRLTSAEDLKPLDLHVPLTDSASLFLVEWPEIGGNVFEPLVDVALVHGRVPEERVITVTWNA